MPKEKKKKELPAFYQEILSLIPEGSANPMTVSKLSKMTGYSGTAIRNAVHTLRVTYKKRIGTSNLVGNSGYFMITNDEERDATVANMMSRIKKMSAVVKALKSIPNEDQVTLDI